MMGEKMDKFTKFWKAIMKDARGSAMILMTFSLIPLLVSLGCGLDYARALLIRNKLQEAVDSAALAGRRTMKMQDIETAKPGAMSYLAFNFPKGTYGSSEVVSTITKPEAGTVKVVASTNVPTTLMAIMGVKQIPISVMATAKQNYENYDIVMVLDVTGSMTDKINGKTKIAALQESAKAFYAQLEAGQKQLREQGLRMRFSIVPYAAAVNAGKLLMGRNSQYVSTYSMKYYHWYYEQSTWKFGAQRTYNLPNYLYGQRLGNVNNANSDSQATWGGCVEEPKTSKTIVPNDTRLVPPSDAYDLNPDLVPFNNDTRWMPYIGDPKNGGANGFCPSEIYPLEDMNKTKYEGIIDTLKLGNNTFHDIGMVWGIRMLSGSGVFASDNPSTYGGEKVNKIIVFMTDGTLNTKIDSNCCGDQYTHHSTAYSGYGIEKWDKRVGGTSDSNNDGRHNKRFEMECNIAKGRGISVWTIGFDTGRVASLDKCASNLEQSVIAKDADELIERFAAIARNIGPLRLSR